MSFLNPLFLAAGAAVLIPLVLHLVHRQERRRIVFPALRYLLLTEKEHARRIRLRQLLLLVIRCAVVVLLVLAGARLVVRGGGSAHPPTAVVVIIDNSASAGRVLGSDRVLDRLKDAALAGIAAATEGDRIWVIRAGEPWDIAVPGTPTEARARIRTTELSGARGDLSSALRRARGLLAEAGLEGAEIHLVSDLQASAFDLTPPDEAEGTRAAPTLVWSGIEPADVPNRHLADVTIGGGLPPLAGARTEIAVTVEGGDPEDDVSVRLLIGGELRGAATLAPGGSTVLPIGPFAPGWVEGWVETDPDALRDDDRRWFAVPVRSPPAVALAADGGPFLSSALDVLADAGRAVRSDPSGADVVFAPGAAGLPADDAARVVVLAPADPALLPAANRRLADAGIAWSFHPEPTTGEAGVAESRIPVDIATVRVRERYRLDAPVGTPGEVLVRLSDGAPWLVALDDGPTPVLLLASPLDDRASTLPVDAAMLPFLEWVVTGWSAGGNRPTIHVGDPLPLSVAATEVETPDGTRLPVDGALELRTLRSAGIHRIMAGDSLLDVVAVNAPPLESRLAPLDRADAHRIGPAVVWVNEPRRWGGATFTLRHGAEGWRGLLAAAVLLLLLESWIATSGGRRAAPSAAPAPTPT